MNCAKSFAEIKHESFEFMELGENPSSGGICFKSTAWHAEWRFFQRFFEFSTARCSVNGALLQKRLMLFGVLQFLYRNRI